MPRSPLPYVTFGTVRASAESVVWHCRCRECGRILGGVRRWAAESGRVMGAGKRTLLRMGEADRSRLDPAVASRAVLRWRLAVPFFGTRVETFQVVGYLIVISAYLFHFVEQPWRGWLPAALWTAFIAGFALSERLQDRFLARGWAVAYIALRVLLAGLAVCLSEVSFLSTFLFFIVAANGWGISARLGRIALAFSAIAVYAAMFLVVGFGRYQPYVTLLPWLAGLGFTGATAHLARSEREARGRSETLLGELSEAHRQLQRYAEQAGELATTQERNRLAREIHDSLGHYLTIINVQLESALVLRPRDEVRAERAVGEAKRLASEALADVRRSVAALHPTALDAVPIGQAIERQVADFREHSGLPVELAIEGDEGRCSQAVGLALYRAVQEGLTNIRKHAAATQVTIRLRFGPATTELAIADDGRGLPGEPPSAPRADGGGIGLVGLRERLSLLGGTLDIHDAARGGTELVATIPNRG